MMGPMPPSRVNGLVLLLCAMALGSLVEPVPGEGTTLFWLTRAAGVSLAIVALFVPRLQRAALAGVAGLLVVAPCLLQMWMRTKMGPETQCHDSVVQFEASIRMVREGRNPYAENYHGTPLEKWRGWKENPALHHFVYPPFLLVLSVPFE